LDVRSLSPRVKAKAARVRARQGVNMQFVGDVFPRAGGMRHEDRGESDVRLCQSASEKVRR